MRSQRRDGVREAGLPQHGYIEQSLDDNRGGATAHPLPAIQAAFAERQKTVSRRAAVNRAAV